MTTPFRTRPDEGPQLSTSEAVHDAVHQMVRQFADPMAWLRELVQNALDAGATAITVHLDYQADRGSERGTLRASVSDDGSGMDQDTIERSLVVLFRSTKDRDPTKIGKFGVGFFSVFGAGPSVVTVDTGRADAPESLRLTFRPDFTYELEALPPRRGTTVTLTLAPSASEADAFAERAHAALARWCPHIAAPLHLRTDGIPAGDRDVRIDRPFDIDGAVTLTHRVDARTVLALAVDPVASVAFYNRGILLHETTDTPLPGVRWKVDAHELHHTVSRDNVRRDAAFARAQQLAAELARGPLRERFVAHLAAVAQRCAAARHAQQPPSDAAHLGALARLAPEAPYKLKPAEVPWPLAHPLASAPGRVTASFAPGILQRPERRYATGPSALTAALARKDIAVVDLGAAGPAADALLTLLRAHHHEDRVAPAADRYLLARPLHPNELVPHARKLLDALRPLLPALGLREVALGALEGHGHDRAFAAYAHDPRATEHLLDAPKDEPFTFDDGRALLLRVDHPRVAAAVDAARVDPALAALTLLRAVALEAGALDARRDLALFTLATPA
ncbi:MAG: ATP-binding protein [Deltaproteobacteria bacterium]|nr:ATP-binding protein [Myxococcales bacterium]MDP3220962.1 ATP-binding protein [Deltaproteobacteria bacterium]